MKIAISTVSMADMGWQEALAEAADAGYKAVEVLMIRGFAHFTPDEVAPETLRAELDRRGLTAIALHAGGIDGASEEGLSDSLAYLDRICAYAAEMGVELVNINGGFTPPGVTADERAAMPRRIGAGLASYEPALASRGLRLTLENHFGFQLQTPEDYEAVFAALPDTGRIGATVDTGHFTAAQVDMPPLVRALGSRVFHVHMKDHIGLQSVGLGQGQTDNAAVVAALREVGYDGYISIELEVADKENEARYIREALPYVERLLAG